MAGFGPRAGPLEARFTPMRIVAANLFCLNVRPTRAVAAVAAQRADVVAAIEATGRFDRRAATRLPPRRSVSRTRRGGLPVALYAREHHDVELLGESGAGWIEWRVGTLHLLVVHAIAPYLPWRWRRRERQLEALAARLRQIHEAEPDAPALALGDFNTADFEPAWRRLEARLGHWRRLGIAGPLQPNLIRPGHRRLGTWPLGSVWSPICLDHVVAAPALHGEGAAERPVVQAFAIPGSDHKGLVVDAPLLTRELAEHQAA